MRDAIDGIDGVVADASFEGVANNWGIQRAVERGLEIISEASRHLTALAPEIPWRQIVLQASEHDIVPQIMILDEEDVGVRRDKVVAFVEID